jgi:predicted dehydrogenase
MVIYGQKGVISATGRGGNFRLYQRDEGGRYPRGWSEVDADGNVVAEGPAAPPAQAAGPGAGPAARREGADRGPGRGGRRDPTAPSADIAHWAECVLQGKKPILSAEHARHVVEIMEKAVIASQTGQAQTLTTTF